MRTAECDIYHTLTHFTLQNTNAIQYLLYACNWARYKLPNATAYPTSIGAFGVGLATLDTSATPSDRTSKSRRPFSLPHLGDETDVDVAEVALAHFELELSEGLNEGHALNVTDGATQLRGRASARQPGHQCGRLTLATYVPTHIRTKCTLTHAQVASVPDVTSGLACKINLTKKCQKPVHMQYRTICCIMHVHMHISMQCLYICSTEPYAASCTYVCTYACATLCTGMHFRTACELGQFCMSPLNCRQVLSGMRSIVGCSG